MRTVCILLLCGCGAPPTVLPPLNVQWPLTLSECTSTMLTNPPLQARFVIPDLDITCLLTVTRSADGKIETTGSCPDVPLSETPGTKVKLLVQWYVLSPNVKKEVMIGEVQGTLELTQQKIKTPTYTADFAADAEKFAVFTKATPLQPSSEKDRFNCDRHGQLGPAESPCDSTKPIVQSIGDKDNCSNLEELCKGTLFNSTDEVSCTN